MVVFEWSFQDPPKVLFVSGSSSEQDLIGTGYQILWSVRECTKVTGDGVGGGCLPRIGQLFP